MKAHAHLETLFSPYKAPKFLSQPDYLPTFRVPKRIFEISFIYRYHSWGVITDFPANLYRYPVQVDVSLSRCRAVSW